MSLLTALTSHLLAHAGLSALIGARLYPERLPDSTSDTPNTLPLVTYQLTDDPTSTTHDRKTTFRARVQVDAWGGSYKSAHDVSAQVYAALHGYSGAMGDGSIHVGTCMMQGRRDASDPNVKLFRVVHEFTLAYKELI